MAVLGEAHCVLHAWLRAGNTSASRRISHFLSEALALPPAGWKLRTVSAYPGFFSEELLEFLEERGPTCIVVARLTGNAPESAPIASSTAGSVLARILPESVELKPHRRQSTF